MESSILAQVASAFGAGMLSSVSPCVYPIIPVTLGYLGMQSDGSKRNRVIAFVGGQTLGLILLGLVAVWMGEALGFSSQLPAVQVGLGALLLLAGGLSILGRMPSFTNGWNRVTSFSWAAKLNPSLAAFFFGFGSVLLLSPCTTPILSSVLALVASNATAFFGAGLMVAYSLGFSIVFLLLGLGFLKAGSLPRSGSWMQAVQRVGAAVLVFAGSYYLYTGIRGFLGIY